MEEKEALLPFLMFFFKVFIAFYAKKKKIIVERQMFCFPEALCFPRLSEVFQVPSLYVGNAI